MEATKRKVTPMSVPASPVGYSTVNPFIITRDADGLIKFVTEVFDGIDHPDVRTMDNDGLLLHLLLSDLLRMTVSTYEAGDVGVTDRLLAFVDWCLREGDDYVNNAVVVSFVEHFGAHPGESDALLARWPPALRTELGR